jgi:light-regulated signal transduction histidine kinase (bacteriophytochrome)
MKPIISEERDSATLQNLGRASLQVIHDIKNQLNGLKLYATFLRKRMEKGDQPADEQETVAKLVAGLERAANDLTVLVQYACPIVLHKQSGVDIQKIMRGVWSSLRETPTGDLNWSLVIDSDSAPLIGEFDSAVLTDALQAISLGALRSRRKNDFGTVKVSLRREDPTAVIQWEPVSFEDGDPFRSFNGSDAIKMSLAAKGVEAHGGSAEHQENLLRVRLPLAHS